MAVVAPPPQLSERPRAPGQAHGAGTRRARVIWCALALGFGLLLAFRASAAALADDYLVHDDVRQHVFWVPRLHDPELFRADPIADYFAAQAPPGFVATYFLGTLALDAISFSKLLPFALTLLLAGFAFLLGLRLFRRTLPAGLGAVLLTWLVWQYDDIASATARSFAMPLLVAFLAFLVAEQRRAALATLTLQALIYPIACPIMLGVQAGGCSRAPTAASWPGCWRRWRSRSAWSCWTSTLPRPTARSSRPSRPARCRSFGRAGGRATSRRTRSSSGSRAGGVA
jgi:hypothetical protein